MTCKEAARLVSEKKDRDLPWYSRLKLRLHLAFCAACSHYRDHLEMISQISAAAGELFFKRPMPSSLAEVTPLSPAAKQRIIDEINRSKS